MHTRAKRALSAVVTSAILGLTLLFSPSAHAVVVTNTADRGPGSLRASLDSANSADSDQVTQITFDIPGDGPHTINLVDPLPTLVGSASIDGTTQPGFSGAPLVVIDAAGFPDGLAVENNASFSIDSIRIDGFAQFGVVVANIGEVNIRNLDVSRDGDCDSASGLGVFASFVDMEIDGLDARNRGDGLAVMFGSLTLRNGQFSGSGCGDFQSAAMLDSMTTFSIEDSRFAGSMGPLRLSNMTDVLVTDSKDRVGAAQRYAVLPEAGGVSLALSTIVDSRVERVDLSQERPCDLQLPDGLLLQACQNVVVDGVSVADRGYGIIVEQGQNATITDTDFSRSGCAEEGVVLAVQDHTGFVGNQNSFAEVQGPIALHKLSGFTATSMIGDLVDGSDYLLIEDPGTWLQLTDLVNSTITHLDLSQTACQVGDPVGISAINCENLGIYNTDVSNRGSGIDARGGSDLEITEVDFSGSGCGSDGETLAIDEVESFVASHNTFRNPQGPIRLAKIENLQVIGDEPDEPTEPTLALNDDGTPWLVLSEITGGNVSGVDLSGPAVCNPDQIALSVSASTDVWVTDVDLSARGSAIVVAHSSDTTFDDVNAADTCGAAAITVDSSVGTSLVRIALVAPNEDAIRVTGRSIDTLVSESAFTMVNSGQALVNTSSDIVLAEDNYWSACDGPSPLGGSGASYSGDIDAVPFLELPPLSASWADSDLDGTVNRADPEPEDPVPPTACSDVADPDVADPDDADLDVADPDVADPNVADPDVVDPELPETGVADPSFADPEVADPAVADPEVSDPEVSDPEVSDPEVSELEVADPGVAQPEVAEGTGEVRESTESGDTQSDREPDSETSQADSSPDDDSLVDPVSSDGSRADSVEERADQDQAGDGTAVSESAQSEEEGGASGCGCGLAAYDSAGRGTALIWGFTLLGLGFARRRNPGKTGPKDLRPNWYGVLRFATLPPREDQEVFDDSPGSERVR